MQGSYSGNTSAFQADAESSILLPCSIFRISMNQERLKELVTQALNRILFESIEPSCVVESEAGAGRIEIPLVFADNFAQLILQESNNGTT